MALAKGWSAWEEKHAAAVRRRQLLSHSAARLSKPKLTACFKAWQHSWDDEQKEQQAIGYKQLVKEQAAQRRAAEAALAQAQADLKESKDFAERAANTPNPAAEQARMLAEELERERDKRVQHLQSVALRRIGQMELAKGWQAWFDQYMSALRCKQLIASSAARMSKPKMVAAYKVWHSDWDEAQRAEKEKSFGQMLKEQSRLRRQVENELREAQQSIRELRTELVSAKEKIPDGNPEAERARLLAEQLETEREKRVAHLQQVAARRIGQMELSKGWQAWFEQYLAALRCKQLIKSSAARMAKPKLTAAFKVWEHDWDMAMKESTEKSYGLLLKEQADARRKAEDDLSKIKTELAQVPLRPAFRLICPKRAVSMRAAPLFHTAPIAKQLADDTTLSLNPALAEAKLLAEQLEAERERRVEQVGEQALRRIMLKDLAAGWQSWHDQYLKKVRCRQLIAGSAARLSKPKLVASYKVWHEEWDEAQKAKSQKGFAVLLKEQTDLRRQVEEQLKQLQAVHAELENRLAFGESMVPGNDKSAEAERTKLLQEQLEREREAR
eukprot:2610958-Prymnesium_polylepis.1